MSHNYDDSWQQWLDCEIYGPTLRHQRKNILSLIKGLQCDSILDVGGGSGDNLNYLIKNIKPKSICLTDISSEALGRAKNLIPNAEFVQLNIEKESLDKRYDLVICCDVLEHIEEDVAALKNIRKMVGKYFVISTLSGRMRDSEKYVGHVRNYSTKELLNKLAASGFEPLKVVKWGFPFYSPIYRNIWDKFPQSINQGKFGIFRKIFANILYVIFQFNSSQKGDYLFILLKPV